jgi:ATP-dependent RNA helicase DeaD
VHAQVAIVASSRFAHFLLHHGLLMTNEAGFSDVLDPALVAALEGKGFTTLTEVQRAVLAPSLAGRDLRISSQTGSGKTVAVGLVLYGTIALPRDPAQKGPRALVIAPTRELARQFENELSWLYAKVGTKVASITGGASYRDEHRALASRPDVVVGTPGRLIDHLERGTLDLTSADSVVLDEADRMLDLGFREDLETILSRAPEERRTHLVSATFADDVVRLADRVQKRALHVQGTRLGQANADIEHIVHLVDPRERFDAIVNLLLAHHDASTLVFAKTRADVASIAEDLSEAGFAVAPLSGEMEQRERTRALNAFKRGTVRVLVATDVAARGIDVKDVTLVLHVEPPTDADSYTHRSGRTGRAGRKGTSALLVAPRELPGVRRVLGRASIRFRMEPIPDAASIRRAIDERLIANLSAKTEIEPDERTLMLARRLMESGEAERTIARLLAKSPDVQGPAPRAIRPIQIETRAERPRAAAAGPERHFEHAPDHGRRAPRTLPPERPRQDARDFDRNWTLFHVTWGALHGADPRRVVAMLCRRGAIESSDIGGIRVGPHSSEVQIAEDVAQTFAEAAGRPDPRDPRVSIRPGEAFAAPRNRRKNAPRPVFEKAEKPRVKGKTRSARVMGGSEPPRRASR